MPTEAAAFASVDSVSVVPLTDDISVEGSEENPVEDTTNDDKDNTAAVPILVDVAAAGIRPWSFLRLQRTKQK